ncbi:uncharacterized protein [Clytia hemisphaerica]|uniref:uncharacterized protein n=1 Tax=Clytia hemisphaerica TaxID=252671 RepID=UPI0034D3B0A8|eukprot:TCONS_00012551-protein
MMLNYVVTEGITVGRLLRLSTAAAVTGYATGECYRNVKAHPGVGKSILGYSIVGGTVGSLFGVALGLRAKKSVIPFVLSQGMYGSLVTACYCNVHSWLKHKQLKLKEKPIQDVTVSVLSGAFTGGVVGLIPGLRILPVISFGTCFGFFGHYIYSGIRIIRLEFLIQQNYTDLVERVKESEAWMDDQERTNPYYAGPITPKPYILEWLGSLWGDFGQNTEEKRRRFESE